MRGRISNPARYFRQFNNGEGHHTGFGECVDQTPPQDKPPSTTFKPRAVECQQISYEEYRRQLDAQDDSQNPVEMQQIQQIQPATISTGFETPGCKSKPSSPWETHCGRSKTHSRPQSNFPSASTVELQEVLVQPLSATDVEADAGHQPADDVDDQDFSSESIALSGDDRVSAIRAVLLVFCAQVLVCCATAGILLCNGDKFLPTASLRIFALGGLIVTAYAAYQSYCVLNSCKWLSMINFGVFSGCLSVNLASLGMLLPSGMMNHWMAQFCAAVLGLTIYAWMTRYEEWSTKEETIFNLVPVVFASAVMLFFLGNNYLSIIGSGLLSFGICRLLQDCSKDSFSCLERLDLLCGEVIGLYSSCLGRLHFLLSHKFQKNFLHKSTVI